MFRDPITDRRKNVKTILSDKILRARPTLCYLLRETGGTYAAETIGTTADGMINGGFETAGAGDPDFFADYTETAGDGAIADETTLVHGGSHAAKLTGGATANTTLMQTVRSMPGQQYTLRFWTRGDGTNAGRFRVYDNVNGVNLINTTSTGVTGTTYTQYTTTFTTNAANGVQFQLFLVCPSANGGIAYFDDVELIGDMPGWYFAAGTITYGVKGIDGKPAVVFDGNNSGIQLGCNVFDALWSGDNFTLLEVKKVDGIARWTDATSYRYGWHNRSSTSDLYYAALGKTSGNNELVARRRTGGDPVDIAYTFTDPPLDWFVQGMTFDGTTMVHYIWSHETGFIVAGTSTDAALTAWGTNPLTDRSKMLLLAGNLTDQEWFGGGGIHAYWNEAKSADFLKHVMVP